MIRSFGKWLRLPPEDRRRTARAAFALLRAKASLRASSIQRAHRDSLSRGITPPVTPPAEALTVARSFARAVERAARGLPFSTSCLDRSVALQRLLQRQELATDLRIGVRQSPEGFAAHAWLELAGTVINDAEDVHERYSAFSEAILPSRLELH